MKIRFLNYAVVVAVSYLSGVLFYKIAQHLLAIPEKSEIDLLYPWITIFFIFFSIPIYFVVNLFFRVTKSHFVIVNFIFKTIVLMIFGIFTAIIVPFMFGGFGYLSKGEFFFSDFAILLYSFFVGAAILFSICTTCQAL